jgi:hypothetical protein
MEDFFMDLQQHFTEEDHKSLVNYLNMVDKHAVFGNMTQKEVIAYFKSLAFVQQVFLKKVEDHIMEVKKVVSVAKPEAPVPAEKPVQKIPKRK